MSKLYYTDPLAAAYMAREFKVRILLLNPRYEEDNGQDPFKWSSNWLLIMESCQDGFEKGEGDIHLDDYHIFDPQVSDLVTNTHDKGNAEYRPCSGIVTHPGGGISTDITISVGERHNGKRYFCEDKKSLQIIQRNNKPSFWPMEDKDND